MIVELLFAAALTGGSGVPGTSLASTPDTPTDVPAPTFMTSCTAQLDCPSPPFSGPVSCTGNSSCHVFSPSAGGYWGVVCDDNTWVRCSCSGMPEYCASPYDYCACRLNGQTQFNCIIRWWCV